MPLLVCMMWCSAALVAQKSHPGPGMELPDTTGLPSVTVEQWNGLPKGANLPHKVDLSPWFPPAGDQGRQRSCVPWALCYMD